MSADNFVFQFAQCFVRLIADPSNWVKKTLQQVPTNELYYNIMFVQFKYKTSVIFRPFMDHPQGMYINIFTKRRPQIDKII